MRNGDHPIWFQCHHGVPASHDCCSSWLAKEDSFNATTAFLLLGQDAADEDREEIGFNATTAFLLPFGPGGPAVSLGPFQCHHGVPASMKRRPPPGRQIRVSMPPRRSCFAMAPVLADALASRFNATTAFLLRFSTNSSKSG